MTGELGLIRLEDIFLMPAGTVVILHAMHGPYAVMKEAQRIARRAHAEVRCRYLLAIDPATKQGMDLVEIAVIRAAAIVESKALKPEPPAKLPVTPPPEIPAQGFVRLKQILRVYPISATRWWEGIKEGRFPKGVKIGPRSTAWRAEDIHALIQARELNEEWHAVVEKKRS